MEKKKIKKDNNISLCFLCLDTDLICIILCVVTPYQEDIIINLDFPGEEIKAQRKLENSQDYTANKTIFLLFLTVSL